MKNKIPILLNQFYHDGRGPELQRVVWKFRGNILSGFEYYNPDDIYDEQNIKHLVLEKVEVYRMCGEEVHPRIYANGKTQAAIFKIEESEWKKKFNQSHLKDCDHYQIMFYDEVYDIICKSIKAGKGKLKE
jgi:hypothetical protein